MVVVYKISNCVPIKKSLFEEWYKMRTVEGLDSYK